MSYRKFIIVSILFLLTVDSYSQKEAYICPNEGETIALLLDEEPTICYQDSNIIVNTKTSNYQFHISDVRKISFKSELPASISNTETKNSIKQNLNIKIYTLSGVLVKETKEGQPLDVSSLKDGEYVIKQGKSSTIFIKKKD